MSDQPLRVVQWATGNIGTKALRGVLDHPGMELVGVRVYGEDKVGRDAGALCGRPDVGVTATDDPEELHALGADCVLHTASATEADDLCRLLAAGTNVVTTRGTFHHPPSMEPDLRERVEDACRQGGTTIHSTGSSPGFSTEAIPFALLSIQRRLDMLAIEEFADLSQRPSPELLFDVMGYGQPPADMGPERAQHLVQAFGPSLRLIAEAVGLPLDDVVGDGEVAVCADDLEIAAGTIPAGTVAAQRVTVSGMRNGEPLLRFRANWYCSADLTSGWELQDTGWRVRVEGDAPLDVAMPFPISLDQMAETAPGYTANRAVNAVEAVCAAEPGIRTSLDLPHIVARFA